jgi:hypothetical protein
MLPTPSLVGIVSVADENLHLPLRVVSCVLVAHHRVLIKPTRFKFKVNKLGLGWTLETSESREGEAVWLSEFVGIGAMGRGEVGLDIPFRLRQKNSPDRKNVAQHLCHLLDTISLNQLTQISSIDWQENTCNIP